jgi:hypothetical protein
MKGKITILFFAVLAFSMSSFADVKDSGATGFTIVGSFTAKGTPDEVYHKIVAVGEWWSSDHTYSQDAHNLTLDAKGGGCWCEKLPKVGGSVVHMQVATAWPGMMLVLTGGLGPLQAMGASGAMTFKLTPAAEGTKVDFMYVVNGYNAQGMNAIATPVNGVLMEALARLHNYVDTGNAELRK